MILRRLTKHVNDQNWFAVVLDFFIVVAGILIAFQITNWSEAQKEDTFERQYLERLRDEIALSAKQARASIASQEEKLRSQRILLEALNACTLDDETRPDVVDGIFRIGQFEPPSLVRGVINELQSTGRMGIISNIDLRQELTEILKKEQSHSDVRDYIVERFSPQIAYVDARQVINLPDGETYWSDFNPDWMSFDFPTLCVDPLYLGAVSSIQFGTSVTVSGHEKMVVLYEAFLHNLDEELGIAQNSEPAINEVAK